MEYKFRLRDLREDNDYSLEYIASILSCSFSNCGRMEKDNNIIRLKDLDLLANLYNTSTDYITKLTNNKKSCSNNKKYNALQTSKIIYDLRIEAKLTQKDLAKKLKSNQATISKIEGNTRELNTLLAIEYTKIFNVSLDYLMGRTETKEKY